MDRREFFRRSVGKVAETAIKEADARAEKRAVHWVRPPWALPELEFLLACTRCHDCIEACPTQVIFPLAARLGADVAGTPALDLLNKVCLLCEDWPCVTSCEPKALQRNTDEADVALPAFARAVIDVETCLPFLGPECGACAGSCPVAGALEWQAERPVINASLCVGCAQCRAACILEEKAVRILSLGMAEG
ncbi:MAG: hypothetical protein OEZ39_18825 [Gammaproteobacteria bacterium]|nr:hypothetical protein [Gammaproteobacteria bacterium]MDH5653919.1 hypothetical protein [Gammaproteobacteria bacterium]